MARTLQAMFEVNTSAAAGNLNGGGFNPYNANFPTDLATTSGTSATPTVSAAFAFTNTENGHFLYVKSGTNWIPGFYPITSQSGGVATLNAAIGAASVWNEATGQWLPNTVQGIATQDTPGGNSTYGIDYSRSTTAPWAAVTDLSTAAGTTNPSVVTSATVGFASNHVGNFIHVTAGTNWTVNGTSTAGLQSWYEIVSVSGGSATLSDNQAVGTAVDLTVNNGTFYLGGAISLGSSTANRIDDSFFELCGGANGGPSSIMWIKAGTFTGLQSVSPAAVGGTLSPTQIIGYNTVRGDITVTNSLTRPVMNYGASTATLTDNWVVSNLNVIGTAAIIIGLDLANKITNTKMVNNSSTTTRTCLNGISGGGTQVVYNCELTSYRGYGYTSTTSGAAGSIAGCYIHDCDTGFRCTDAGGMQSIYNNIFENCFTAGVDFLTTVSTTATIIDSNTFYGAENKFAVGSMAGLGVRFNITGTRNKSLRNNILYGFKTAVTHVDTQSSGVDDYNDYYNNTADVSAVTQWQKGQHDIAIDPAFTSVTQLTGTAGSIASANKLIDTTKDFTTLGVAAGQTVTVTGGTGATTGIYYIDSISTTTNANDTLNMTIPASIGTNAAGDVSYQITLGHNFLPTGAV